MGMGLDQKWRFLLAVWVIALLFLAGVRTGGQAAEAEREQGPRRVLLPLVQKPGGDLSVAAVKILQGTSPSAHYSVYIVDRPTVVRVFIGTTEGTKRDGVTGRLCGYNAQGEYLGCIKPSNPPIHAPSKENLLSSTINFRPPTHWIQTGISYHFELDPESLVSDSNRENNRYPASGSLPFGYSDAPDLDVVVVPVEYQPYGETFSTLPRTDNLSYLTHLAIKVLPVPQAHYELHPVMVYAPSSAAYNLDDPSGRGWVSLLQQVKAIHDMEDPANLRNYYGVVNIYNAHGCFGCITGVGYVGTSEHEFTGAGWSGLGAGTSEASETFVHELGHNFGRGHVDCNLGGSNFDLNYPYTGGVIGQLGLDVINGVLYQPGKFTDYMSYCNPSWTSDYTYWNIYNYRQSILTDVSAPDSAVDALYFSGTISPDGVVSLAPVYSQIASVNPERRGNYVLELLDEHGMALAWQAFNPAEIADMAGYQSFGVFIQQVENIHGVRIRLGSQVLLEQYVHAELRGPESAQSMPEIENVAGGQRVRWEEPQHSYMGIVYRIRFSTDQGKTWRVLSLDWRGPEYIVPANLLAGVEQALLEVQASDGLHTRTRVIRLSPIP